MSDTVPAGMGGARARPGATHATAGWTGATAGALPYWRLVLAQFVRHRTAVVGSLVLALFIILAVLGPAIAPHDPTRMALNRVLRPPSLEFPLGTDELGRDLLSRIIVGARITLLITFAAVAISLGTGTLTGLVAGYYGRAVDTLLMRLMDVLLAMPGFLLAIAIVASLGPGERSVIIAVGIYSIPAFARLARGSTLSVRAAEYVQAGRALGATNARLMARHVLPNIVAPLLVMTSLRMATAILTVSGLSFLGLGPQPPTPEWGAMLSVGRNHITSHPALVIVPGLAILLVTLSFNLVGDGLRDALDPRLRR